MEPVDVSYSVESGEAIRGGRVAPIVTGLLGAAVAAMAAGTMQQYLGTNMNEMQPKPTGFGTQFDADGDLGIFESAGGYLIPQWAGKWSFDPATGLFSGVGTAQGFTSTVPAGARSKAIYFNSTTNAFSCQWSPTNKNEAHNYDGNVSRPLNGRAYRRGYNSTQVWGMDVATKVWALDFSTTSTSAIVAIDVFPEINALVAVDDLGRVYTIDPATGVNTLRGTVAGLAQYNVCMYVGGAACVVFGGGGVGTRMYRMGTDFVITEIVHTIPAGLLITANASGGSVLPHPGGEPAIVVTSHPLNAFWKLNVLTGEWVSLLNFPSGFTNAAALSIGMSMHGTGAIVLFKQNGRSSGVTQCQFWIFKVPA